jgi:hypothetical protein
MSDFTLKRPHLKPTIGQSTLIPSIHVLSKKIYIYPKQTTEFKRNIFRVPRNSGDISEHRRTTPGKGKGVGILQNLYPSLQVHMDWPSPLKNKGVYFCKREKEPLPQDINELLNHMCCGDIHPNPLGNL